MRTFEIGTAAGLMLVAAIAMFDSFRRSGWTASGPDAGFYPFWSAAMMGVASAIILVRSLRGPDSGPFFASSHGAAVLAKLSVPMVAAVVLIDWVGFYVVSGAYMALFARWVGRYNWVIVAGIALGLPIALYLVFERGFRVPLPKSL